MTSKVSSIFVCMGTRPEIIKMAPVVRALRLKGVDVRVIHTGQHEDMAWPLYDFFEIQPFASLKIQRLTGSLAELSAQLLKKLDALLEQHNPSMVLVHGDTLSALMAAQTAFMRKIAVGHVEAGLRSGSSSDPFPEEMNRQCIGRLASIHFAPTEQAKGNLLKEGISAETIHVTGNTVVDAVQLGIECLSSRRSNWRWGAFPVFDSGPQILVTAHRRENWGGGVQRIASAVAKLLALFPKMQVIWPLHTNPRVQEDVRIGLGKLPPNLAERLHLTPPLEYPDLLDVMQKSALVMTDSGGIQEEAVTLKIPLLVLRETTERPEVIQSGYGALVGTDPAQIVHMAKKQLELAEKKSQRLLENKKNPFGDGFAAERIALHVKEIVFAQPLSNPLLLESVHAYAI